MENAVPEKQSPFATEPIGRLIVRFTVPSVIALLVNSLYNIVDQIFIGWGVGYLGKGATNIAFSHHHRGAGPLHDDRQRRRGLSESEAGGRQKGRSQDRCGQRRVAGLCGQRCAGSGLSFVD